MLYSKIPLTIQAKTNKETQKKQFSQNPVNIVKQKFGGGEGQCGFLGFQCGFRVFGEV